MIFIFCYIFFFSFGVSKGFEGLKFDDNYQSSCPHLALHTENFCSFAMSNVTENLAFEKGCTVKCYEFIAYCWNMLLLYIYKNIYCSIVKGHSNRDCQR